jgi:hypothetical protein
MVRRKPGRLQSFIILVLKIGRRRAMQEDNDDGTLLKGRAPWDPCVLPNHARKPTGFSRGMNRIGAYGMTVYYLLGGMKSAFRFRLYPNRRQEQKLMMMIEAGRQLWNDALAHRKRRWEGKRLSTSYT